MLRFQSSPELSGLINILTFCIRGEKIKILEEETNENYIADIFMYRHYSFIVCC
jgi:hypothetical protein